jgi:hypothetical protein
VIRELPSKANNLRSNAVTRIRSLAAPLAEAAPTCTTSGLASLCQSDGNAQVSATPPDVGYQSQYPFFGDVLVFHHGGR